MNANQGGAGMEGSGTSVCSLLLFPMVPPAMAKLTYWAPGSIGSKPKAKESDLSSRKSPSRAGIWSLLKLMSGPFLSRCLIASGAGV